MKNSLLDMTYIIKNNMHAINKMFVNRNFPPFIIHISTYLGPIYS